MIVVGITPTEVNITTIKKSVFGAVSGLYPHSCCKLQNGYTSPVGRVQFVEMQCFIFV